MDPFKRRAKIAIVASSGIVGVTIPPTRSWFLILAALAGDVAFAAITYSSWATTSLWIRLIFIWAIVGGALALVYQLAVTQIIAFDSLRLTIGKEFNGWERKHEYQVADCSDLEWVSAAKGRPAGLQCKAGWRTVIVGKDLSEEEAAEVLAALQISLPGVAQKLCSNPNSKDHFIALGLGRSK
jgi:hypothetical protein